MGEKKEEWTWGHTAQSREGFVPRMFTASESKLTLAAKYQSLTAGNQQHRLA